MTRKYQDGDAEFSLIRPGDSLPSEHGPVTSRDFHWVKGSLLERLRGRSVARSIEELKGGLELAAQYQHAAKAYEESRQALALAREQAAFLPIKLEQERQRLTAQLLAVQGELEEIVRRRELAQADHEILLLEREEQRLAMKLRIKKMKLKRRDMKAERQQRQPTAADRPTEDAPEAFGRYWATEQEVRRNRSAADERVEAIYRRAAAERRQLSDDELEEVDALTNAASGAEGEIRRRAAGDL
jgi:hypothetical protein